VFRNTAVRHTARATHEICTDEDMIFDGDFFSIGREVTPARILRGTAVRTKAVGFP
jgi:hypothetical protein